MLKWSYGVTTVPVRMNTTLPRTLRSLAAAGFNRPRLFVDGDSDHEKWSTLFGCECTMHNPPLRIHGNWVLALSELWVREPYADRYAVFQDDIVAVAGLRSYLDACPFPQRGYLNLYTYRDNEDRIKGLEHGTWVEAARLQSGGLSGKGALGLIFDREGVLTLLTARHLIERPSDGDPYLNWRKIDGGIADSMYKAGWSEWVHCPSLLQHTGEQSTIEGKPPSKLALSFPGEKIDATAWIKK